MGTSHKWRVNRNLRGGALVSALVFLVSLVSLGWPTLASGTHPTPPKPVAIDAVASTDNSGIGGAVPDVLVEIGEPFTLTVSLEPEGSAFTKDTKLSLAASLASGAQPAGALSTTWVIMPAGVNTKSFSVSYSAPDNGLQVTVSVVPSYHSPVVSPGTTAAFDVLKALDTFAGDDPRLETGLGVGDAECTRDTTEPECGTLVLSNGIPSGNGALSLGACTADLGCSPGSQIVQFVADLGTAYSKYDPAVLIIRCSKELCHGKSLKHIQVKLSFEATGPLNLISKPCKYRGKALDKYGHDYCTDYSQSRRDRNGDALLYVLFTHDMRGST
jgi:hypothetical protein